MDETPPPVGEQEGTAAAGGGASSSKIKDTTLGDFRLEQKLGAGGMGVVYKARQLSLDREVALKVLSKHLADNPDFVQRFQHEARLMARLDHPNILRGLDVGQEQGFHYFAMEYAGGGSMEDWLRRLGRLSVGDALRVVITCARALQYAHDRGLVHRDIKPDNILLTRQGQVKVADLGLARALTEELALPRTGTGAGTPVYMSPEQGRDLRDVDGRSDIYALGCMLYCFLTGRPPFTGETYMELMEAKEKGQHPPVRRFNDTVPSRLDRLIDRMILNNVKMRYQTCAEVIKDLEGLGLANDRLSFLEGEGSETRPAVTAPKEGGLSSAAATPAKAPAEARGRPAGGDFWFLTYTARDGRSITRKMTTGQVLDLVKTEDFDPKTVASRTREEGYHPLVAYREFEAAVRGRLMKARADRGAPQLHKAYAAIGKDVKRRKGGRGLGSRFRGGIGLLIGLAVLAAVAGAYFLIRFLIG